MKRSRSYRIHQKERVIKNRVRQVKTVQPSSRTGLACVRYKQQLAIRHPYDCGQTNCPLCRRDKKEVRRKKLKNRVVED